jgi:hypothetical protein
MMVGKMWAGLSQRRSAILGHAALLPIRSVLRTMFLKIAPIQ